ncbi:MAG: DUF1801 domain-containing protein [Anaerolineae bacterium]|jgi:uncharacterized protein YdhG (YjbR/CyaY superfamily)|nr:DUF1801 domain-containing protein [Anaerolineae bacterium]
MGEKRPAAASVDEYIASFPEETQAELIKIRALIRETLPEAEERISYGIPGYYQNGQVIFFAGFARHISVYPAPDSVEEFKEDLDKYQKGKGTFQFPLGQPIPYDLIRRTAEYRLAQNLSKKKTPRRKQDEDREGSVGQ